MSIKNDKNNDSNNCVESDDMLGPKFGVENYNDQEGLAMGIVACS